MTNLNISHECPVLPPQARLKNLPYAAMWILMGAEVYLDHSKKTDLVRLLLDNESMDIATADYETAKGLADYAQNLIHVGKVVSAVQALSLHKLIADKLAHMADERVNTRKIAMIKDRTGSGYWRMVLPANHISMDGISVDITSAGMKYEHLLEYDTIFVQRVHDWESYYLLKKLKEAEKHIVYDIDDNLFDIPRENPASRFIGRDEMMAAAECMKLADVVTTTTEELSKRLVKTIGEPLSPVVIPNAIDTEGWLATPFTGSPDGFRRIFWQGGESHAEDWEECADAVDAIMAEMADVRLVILGYLPPAVRMFLTRAHWKGRVEFLGFNAAETYFQIIKAVRAEVGIAPLKQTGFNACKSPIKLLEYSMIGMPTVASNVLPYSAVIDPDDKDGFLVSGSREWFDALSICLNDKKKRLSMLESARQKVRDNYDIRKVAQEWRTVLVP